MFVCLSSCVCLSVSLSVFLCLSLPPGLTGPVMPIQYFLLLSLLVCLSVMPLVCMSVILSVRLLVCLAFCQPVVWPLSFCYCLTYLSCLLISGICLPAILPVRLSVFQGFLEAKHTVVWNKFRKQNKTKTFGPKICSTERKRIGLILNIFYHIYPFTKYLDKIYVLQKLF